MTNRDLTTVIVEAVAKGLTPAMRQTLLWLPDDGSWRSIEDTDAALVSRLYDVAVQRAKYIGEISLATHIMPLLIDGRWSREQWAATDFGLRVRAVVEKMEQEEAA